MSAGKGSPLPVKILVWLACAAMGAAAGIGTAATLFSTPGPAVPWDDALTTFVGVCFLIFIPASLLRWVTVPEARIEGTLAMSLVSMAVTGVSLTLPVLSQGRIDSSIAFVVVLILFAAQAVISLIMYRRADEMIRRYNADSTVISAALLIGAFSIYAAGERLGVIGTISPWGLVGIACIIQYAVSMYVYYRLGMDPDSQEKAAAR